MNPFGRISEFISYPSHGRTWAILGFLILVLAIPLTVNIAQKQQELRQHAAVCRSVSLGTFCSDISQGQSGVSCTSVAGGSPGCPAGSPAFSCTQQICDETSPSPSIAPTLTPTAPATGTCPQITAGGNPGAGGVCKFGVSGPPPNGGDNVNVGTCQSTKCPNGVPVPGHTISVCQLNNCYANDNECWPDQPCTTTGGLTEAQCNAKLAFCSGACTNTTSKNLGTCVDGRICCQDPLEGFPASANTPKSTNVIATPACKGPTHPDNDCPPCANYTKEPTCPSGQPVKRQLDGAWFCWNGANLSDTAVCASSSSTSKCPETNKSACIADVNTCGPAGKITHTFSGQNCTPATEFEACNTASANCPAPNTCNSQKQCVPQNPGTPGPSQLTFALQLDGIGTRGDVKNSGSQKNNPARKSRNVTVDLIGPTTTTKVGNLRLDSLQANVDIGQIPSGTYTVKVKVDGFIKRNEGSFTITTGTNNNLGTLPNALPNGDINRDGTVNAADYAVFQGSGCYGQAGNGSCANEDLDDDGQVTLFDFNLIIREFGQSDE